MAKLPDEIKRFIVERNACFRTPTQVVDDVKEQFQIVIDRRQVEEYDPEKRTKKRTLAKKWCAIHGATRTRFLAECGRQPIADQRIRMRMLQRILELEEQRKNTVGMRQTLEQAAKEAGGAFTNKREVSGEGGGPVTVSVSVTHRIIEAPDGHGGA